MFEEASIQETLTIIKPDGVQRGLVGHIIQRFERAGLRSTRMKMIQASPEMIRIHYKKHENQQYFQGLVEYMASSSIVVICWQGPNAIAVVRKLLTISNRNAPCGTIRGDMAPSSQHFTRQDGKCVANKNVCHASDCL